MRYRGREREVRRAREVREGLSAGCGSYEAMYAAAKADESFWRVEQREMRAELAAVTERSNAAKAVPPREPHLGSCVTLEPALASRAHAHARTHAPFPSTLCTSLSDRRQH